MSDFELPERLAACAAEPIHIPNAIQPHGLLLALDAETGTLSAMAGDLGAVLCLASLDPAVIRDLVGGEPSGVAARLPRRGPALLGTRRIGARKLTTTGHRSGRYAIVEVEREIGERTAASALGAAQALSSRLESNQHVHEVCWSAAEAVREITGFARILVYRFLEGGAGAVMAEARNDPLPSLLNQHFPESDIPIQARRLYARNHVRVIPDVDYRPAPLEWLLDEPPGEPLDMSDCHLRSVSPIHLQYLKNMGVAASASISIMVGGELWGLIACHHTSPKPLDFVQRELCKHVGQLVSANIASRLRSAAQLEAVRLSERREGLLPALQGMGPVEDSLLHHAVDMMHLIPSNGVAVCAGQRLSLAGSSPDAAQTRLLLDKVPSEPEPFATNRLSDHVTEADQFSAAASGVLSICIRHEPLLSVIWFRAERLEVIDWAGNPHKPADTEAGALTPRKSFELWRETVRGEARPWTSAEIEAARRFRSAILDLLDQQELRTLNDRLLRALTDKEQLLGQKDLLMREVHHRVQNSLQLVNSLLYLQQKDAESDEVRVHFERARQRLTAVAMVHRRLWRTDKIGDVRLDTFMAELIDELVAIWGQEWRSMVSLELAPTTLPTDPSVTLGLVMTELLTNAVKYAYGGAPGPILVEAVETADRTLRIAIADRGSGLQPESGSEGFGSRLVKTLVQQLGGTLSYEDNRPGLRAALTIPLT